MRRIDVTLDDEHATKLAMLAEGMHVKVETLARTLLSSALDQADPEPAHIAALLDGIPGLHERVQLAREQARTGDVIPLD